MTRGRDVTRSDVALREVHTFLCVRVCVYEKMCACVRTYVYVCARERVRACVCGVRAYMCGCVHVPVHDSLHSFVRAHIGSCVRVRMRIRATVNGETVDHRVHLVFIQMKARTRTEV